MGGWRLAGVAAALIVAAVGIQAQSWQQVRTSGDPPPARANAAAVYDPVGHRLVMFGGQGDDARLNDVWALDLRTDRWQRIATVGTPPASVNTCSLIRSPSP